MLGLRPRPTNFFFPNPWRVTITITGPSPPARAEEVDGVDVALQRSESGVESALLYAKAWSKYTKELLAWVDKRLSMGESLSLPLPLTHIGLIQRNISLLVSRSHRIK